MNPAASRRSQHGPHYLTVNDLSSDWVANLRLGLQTQVQSRKSHIAPQALPGLIELATGLPAEQRPQLVRGDCAFGNEGVMCELEAIEQA